MGTNNSRNAISALGARITRVWSRDGSWSSATVVESEDGDEVKSLAGSQASPMSDSTRPISRGRELFSTGRGGAGNIHRSLSREGAFADAAAVPAPRGREPAVGADVTHVGRGGVGNVRSPSRPRDLPIDAAQANYEHSLIERYDESPHAFSTGRGGAGNIQTPETSRSRSRGPTDQFERSQSRGRVPNLHSTGRGGAGNITAPLDFSALEEEEDKERAAHAHKEGLHSTGRGGRANITASPSRSLARSPPAVHAQTEGVFSTGRGGAGNFRDRSASREHHALGRFMERVTGHHEHEHEPAPVVPVGEERFALELK